MLTVRRGSVMMEMIVVFPIYLVLFGGLFMLGDMLIKAARLPSAERTAAFELGGKSSLLDVAKDLMYPSEEVDDNGQRANRINVEGSSEYYADTDIGGPFSLRAAVKAYDDYYMPGGAARGQLKFADWFFARSTPNGREMPTGDNGMGNLINQNQIKMHSKDDSFELRNPDYKYNYYTLKRKRNGGENWRANRRDAWELVVRKDANGKRAWRAVGEETFHYDGKEEESKSQPNENEAAEPSNANPRDYDYERYGQFVSWSN